MAGTVKLSLRTYKRAIFLNRCIYGVINYYQRKFITISFNIFFATIDHYRTSLVTEQQITYLHVEFPSPIKVRGDTAVAEIQKNYYFKGLPKSLKE